jgi:hypothetical protein
MYSGRVFKGYLKTTIGWTPMRKGVLAVLALTLALEGQAHVAAQNTTAVSEPSTDGIPCSKFEWSGDSNSKRAIMRVPISMNGMQYWYQLDTGADLVIPYGNKEHEGWISKGDLTQIPKVRFAGEFLPSILAYRMKNVSDQSLQGSVGLDILVGYAFVIDFPKQRVCLMNRPDLPERLIQAASWVPAEIRNGKLFVRADLNGEKLNSIIYDTGSSPDELLMDLDRWKAFTRKASASDATIRESAQSWGKQIEFVGATATGDLRLGDRTFRHPVITTAPTEPTNYHDNYFGADGVLGNALFFNSTVILDLGAHPRFGIISSGHAAASMN